MDELEILCEQVPEPGGELTEAQMEAIAELSLELAGDDEDLV